MTKLQDRSGRVLGSTTSSLRFPWDGETGAATIVVRMSGDGGQRLSLRLNGKPLKTVVLASGWQAVAITVPAGVLRSGENDLGIAVAKKGALFHSLEVLAGPAPEPADAWPAMSPVVTASVAGQEKAALGGFRRYAMLLEVPRQSSCCSKPLRRKRRRTCASRRGPRVSPRKSCSTRPSSRDSGNRTRCRWQPWPVSWWSLNSPWSTAARCCGPRRAFCFPAAPSLAAPQTRAQLWCCSSAMPCARTAWRSTARPRFSPRASPRPAARTAWSFSTPRPPRPRHRPRTPASRAVPCRA